MPTRAGVRRGYKVVCRVVSREDGSSPERKAGNERKDSESTGRDIADGQSIVLGRSALVCLGVSLLKLGWRCCTGEKWNGENGHDKVPYNWKTSAGRNRYQRQGTSEEMPHRQGNLP